MVSILHEAASASIPVFSRKKKANYFIHDEALKQKCWDSKSAWQNWCEAGRPRSGSVYQQMKDTRNEVKSYVRKGRAKAERKLIQARDDMFKTKDERRFNIHQKKTHCRKLVVNGASITDEEELLECWKNHFSDLMQTQTLEIGDSGINKMEALSHGYEDFILDYDFTVDEIECALKHLKSNKSGGADGLDAEHLKFGGHIVASQIHHKQPIRRGYCASMPFSQPKRSY